MVKYPAFDGSQNCANLPIDFFYKDERHMQMTTAERRERAEITRYTKRLCYTCTFLEDCREWALHHEHYGLWGGLSEDDRKVVRKNRGIKVKDPYNVL
jgi:predicted RecB family nuclease